MSAQGRVRSFDRGNGASVDLVLIEAGSFTMGSLNGELNEQPIHRVTISKPYYIGQFEVTQELWAAVMGTNPSNFKGGTLPGSSARVSQRSELHRRGLPDRRETRFQATHLNRRGAVSRLALPSLASTRSPSGSPCRNHNDDQSKQ